MDFILRFILVDIPEAFLLLTIALALFNHSVFEKWKAALSFAIIVSIPGEVLSYLDVAYQPKILIMYVVYVLTMLVLFRYNILKSVFMGMVAICSLLLSESFVIMVYNSQHIYMEQMFSSTMLTITIRSFYLGNFLLVALCLRILKFDITRLLPQNRYNRYLFLLVLVGSIEFLLILFLNTSFILRENNSRFMIMYSLTSQMIIQILILALFIIIVILFRIYLNLTINRVEEETGTPYLNSIHDLVTAIRSIKHDSLNHYTAINGFLKKGYVDLAKEYVEQLLQETVSGEKKMDTSSQVLENIKNPAVSSLLQSKMEVCFAERISLSMNIKTVNQFSQIKTYDLIKVLGNLFDNAIRATSYELEENRFIRVEWGQSENEHYLVIENSGPTIPKDKLSGIFQSDYTTKKDGDGGLGLVIVKTVTDRYGGKIHVYSEDGVTRFRISFLAR
ncbi:GHKL domain-containing protein [Brevibacillus nitrificans]|uniref:GHKL domain-containing protein n=1 Tax=Brevibacillus nitrificans TaxID=651560 RepID=A0A3M8DPL3_9BACL|nr:ATP-binding protein [Brevibacillus nitrificans]RNB90058.1 GHKL domain-containing protein [Brevibacillus nitrificans]